MGVPGRGCLTLWSGAKRRKLLERAESFPENRTLTEHFISVPTAVPKTTSETLKHKINPSAGETLPHAVDVLLYTPGEQSRLLLAALLSTPGTLGLCLRSTLTRRGMGRDVVSVGTQGLRGLPQLLSSRGRVHERLPSSLNK